MKTEVFGDVMVLETDGPIDHNTSEQFRIDLMPHVEQFAQDGHTIVLDMKAIQYMSSIGLRVLMLAAKQSKIQNGKIAVAGLQPSMREIFEISRFHLFFDIYEDTEAALQTISEKALLAFREKSPERA